MDAYFARQPILDSNLKLYGYELLFRPSPHSNSSGSNILLDGDRATSSVLSAMEWSGIEKVTNKKPAFVNFTERLLLDGIALLYPKEYLVIEILEHIEIHAGILEAVKNLKDKGYTIALDDYEFCDGHSELLPLCDIIKVEVDGSDKSYANLERITKAVNLNKCRLLAEKVESGEVYDKARQLGCSLFQGYFFARPKLLAEKTVNPIKVNQLRLISEVNRPNTDFNSLAKTIKSDMALTYRIMQIANSPYYGLKNRVENINQAILMLGTDDIKKWLIFSALNNLCDDKPSELIILSLTRAFFGEQLAQKLGHGADAEAYFLAGLFSLLDTLTDTALETCLHNMPLADITRRMLLDVDNSDGHRDILELIMAIEHGDWLQVELFCQKWGSSKGQVSDTYMQAIQWTEDIM